MKIKFLGFIAIPVVVIIGIGLIGNNESMPSIVTDNNLIEAETIENNNQKSELEISTLCIYFKSQGGKKLLKYITT